jgi:hypothetical protein
VGEIGFPGEPNLPLVLTGRKDIGLPEEFQICLRVISLNLFLQVLEANHNGLDLFYKKYGDGP